MKLAVNVVHGGRYIRAGDDLPSDFIIPEHLGRFVIYDVEPSQASRADLHLSRVEGHEGAEIRLAKPVTDYDEGEEEFTPKWPRAKKNAPDKKMKGLKKP